MWWGDVRLSDVHPGSKEGESPLKGRGGACSTVLLDREATIRASSIRALLLPGSPATCVASVDRVGVPPHTQEVKRWPAP